ncbi:PREDICTED: uncharacterized protein LOC107342441 [Acropora digitifera]|uniref:uncharacterized protein LOC107342441 n=1 Tax=Acropora digitifera TaxID=70779 RepID=UPI00077B1EA0|nr:PREDICTED: uncharacterized protein LOC107342441 [Acropora digitifera]
MPGINSVEDPVQGNKCGVTTTSTPTRWTAVATPAIQTTATVWWTANLHSNSKICHKWTIKADNNRNPKNMDSCSNPINLNNNTSMVDSNLNSNRLPRIHLQTICPLDICKVSLTIPILPQTNKFTIHS